MATSNPFGAAFAALNATGFSAGNNSIASAAGAQSTGNAAPSGVLANFGSIFSGLNLSGFSGGSIADAAGGTANNKAPPEGQYLGSANTMNVANRLGGSGSMADAFASIGGTPNNGQAGRVMSESNSVKGGITYSTPPLNFGTTGSPAPNSGFSFDMPLSTVNDMTNTALSFTSANSQANRGFFGGVLSGLGGGLNTQAAASTQFLNNSFQGQLDQSRYQTDSLERMFSGFLGATQYNADATVRVAEENNSGGCFITTAICEQDGKADDCDELQTLRSFRDVYMLGNSDGIKLVREYYAKAPAIVLAIKARPDAAWCFEHLKTRYLFPAIAAVKAGDNEQALKLYTVLFVIAKSMAI